MHFERKEVFIFHQQPKECFADITAAKFVREAKMNLSDVVDKKNIPNDTHHPKIKDRIAAIKAIDTSYDYPPSINKKTQRIKTV